jgi:hypothetical protein
MAETDTTSKLTEQTFAEVGKAITTWGFVEERMYLIFTICTGNVIPADNDGGRWLLDHWVPMWVFYSLETFHAKRTILDAAVTGHVYGAKQEEQLLAEWGKLSQKARELASKRNKLAHWTVVPAQHSGSGAEHEPIVPARLLPTVGSPNYWRETGLKPSGKALTRIQIGHLNKAFRLFDAKLRAFARRLVETPELRDKDVRLALDLLLTESRLSPSVRGELQRFLSSLG